MTRTCITPARRSSGSSPISGTSSDDQHFAPIGALALCPQWGAWDNGRYKIQLKKEVVGLIDYDEEVTLRRLCRAHGADDPALIQDLTALIEWAHASEKAAHGGPPPPFLLVLESQLGLHSCPRRGQQEDARGLVAV